MIRGIIWGFIVAAVGAWIWIANVNPQLMPKPQFSRDWPLIIVVAGLVTLGDGIVHAARRRG